MTQVIQRIDSLPLKSLNYPQAVKKWSSENLVDLAKKVLKINMNLDFLLELNPRDFEILVSCIKGRVKCVQES
jgi:hypothetical protein